MISDRKILAYPSTRWRSRRVSRTVIDITTSGGDLFAQHRDSKNHSKLRMIRTSTKTLMISANGRPLISGAMKPNQGSKLMRNKGLGFGSVLLCALMFGCGLAHAAKDFAA